jgi:hypothetical protein
MIGPVLPRGREVGFALARAALMHPVPAGILAKSPGVNPCCELGWSPLRYNVPRDVQVLRSGSI